ncbi:MAG TPA: tRNA (guanosine(46)-N7)-methyltransferase TrmB [Magnetospirillum sp.]|jgi:tRNA (guanine-N7-)-methyltransferase|nr:tRNA (guanosine(46)-N7)-methyltransferase TrmB [Magnetospirillum sp.]
MGNEGKIVPAPERPRFYGRRSGKRLRRTALGLIETLLPRLTVTVPEPGTSLDAKALFPREVERVWLEVGFGGGEHVVAQARLHPEAGIIGSEPFKNGIASLLGHLHGTDIDNVRIFPEDVRQLFPALAPASIDRVFVLFPDPWPKKRHAERRFIGRENLDSLARLLVDGGELRVASDDPIYQEWAAEQLRAHPDFEEIQVTRDRTELPQDWPPTRYELKCLAENAPVFFRFRRKAR